MGFYAFLTVATAAITALAWLIWRKTRNPGFLIGIAALYYWSLYGAWSIVTDQLGGDSGMRYHYLYKKMFAVYLDGDYLMSLMLYTLFVLVVELSILLVARKADSVNHVPRPIEISHPIIIVVGLLAAAGSYLFIRDGLQAAALMNKAAYHVTRGLSRDEVVPFYTLHQLLNRVALYPAVIGIAVWFSGSSPRLIRARRTPWVLPLYFALCAWMFAFAMVLGNKNDLLVPGITGVLFYVANSERPNYGGLVVLGCAGLIGLWMIDLLRGTPFPQFLQAVQNLDFDRLQEAVAEGSASNEAFGAHFSMYGSLIYDVAPTWGSSIVSLLASAVPRVFWPDRPDEIYVYYADQVNAVAGQGLRDPPRNRLVPELRRCGHLDRGDDPRRRVGDVCQRIPPRQRCPEPPTLSAGRALSLHVCRLCARHRPRGARGLQGSDGRSIPHTGVCAVRRLSLLVDTPNPSGTAAGSARAASPVSSRLMIAQRGMTTIDAMPLAD
jgi:hypothetical protein